jgi:TonB family protein
MSMKANLAVLFTLFVLTAQCSRAQDIAQNITTETDTTAAPSDFVPVDVQPKVVDLPTPKYPEGAVQKRIEGRVVVKIWVDERGRTKKAVILESDNEIFNKPSMEAAENAKFTPAMAKANLSQSGWWSHSRTSSRKIRTCLTTRPPAC